MKSGFLYNLGKTKEMLEAEFIEARHQKMGVFLENLEGFLNPLGMTEYAADVFEEVLLEMAGVKTKPKNCQLGPIDESILYIRIQGIKDNETDLFLTFLKSFDSLAKMHFVTEPTFKHFPQELLNAYSFEISKKAVVEKLFPQFVKIVEDWDKNTPEKLKGYIEKSKNHSNLQKPSQFILNPH